MATNAFAAGAYAAIQGLGGAGRGPVAPVRPAGAADFSSVLKGALGGGVEAGKAAETQALAAAAGKADIVDVVTAVAESEAALETLVAVRDRVIAAYEDIMRMPI
jgi:flagellar hook-basal body complex protein FliE